MFNIFCCFGLISKGLLKKNANDAKKYCKNACNMKNKMYICIGKQVEIEPTDTYFKRDKALLRFPKSISCQFAKTIRSNASFCIYIKKIYNKMANWLKFGCSANNSNRVRFYGKTVIDGKVITSKKYRDAFSAIEWGEKQLNRECTAIYGITVSGAYIFYECLIHLIRRA